MARKHRQQKPLTSKKRAVDDDVNHHNDQDSDCDSDSSVVTVVYSPLPVPSSEKARPATAPAADSKKAVEARPTSSSSFESRFPPAHRDTTRTADRRSTPSYDSFFTGPELDPVNPVQNPLRLTGQYQSPARSFPSSRDLVSSGRSVDQFSAPVTTEQFPVLEPEPLHPRQSAPQSSDLPFRRFQSNNSADTSIINPGAQLQTSPTSLSPSRPSNLVSPSRSPLAPASPRPRSITTGPRIRHEAQEAPEAFPELAESTVPTTTSPQPPAASLPVPRRRTRARSNAINRENPLDVPITDQEYQLARLVQNINKENEREAARQAAERALESQRSPVHEAATQDRQPFPTPLEAPVNRAVRGLRLTTFNNLQQLPNSLEDLVDRSSTPTQHNQTGYFDKAATETAQFSRVSALRSDRPNLRNPVRENAAPFNTAHSAVQPSLNTSFNSSTKAIPDFEDSDFTPTPTANPKIGSGNLHIWRVELPPPPIEVLIGLYSTSYHTCKQDDCNKMNFQGYGESPQSGPTNPRQAPPSPSQGMNHQNGVNGGMGPGAGLVGYPTPAGHQSDLNYVMSMVDELAGVLRMNQQLTANVVDKMGKVRERAKHLNLSNDELMAIAAEEMGEEGSNLDREVSELRKALEESDHNKRENFKLAVHGAEILADIAEKVHKFKATHEADTLAWHKNYRKQLADEREENLRLRNEMNDLKAGAVRANGHLRDMRRYLTDNDERHELRVENQRLRTEKRFWKRLALPLIPDDDSEWSDDDDLIDPEEKKRLEAALKEKERIAREEAEAESSSGLA